MLNTYKGAYSDRSLYQRGDLVEHQGQIYTCVRSETTGCLPPDPDIWQSVGVVGSAGISGCPQGHHAIAEAITETSRHRERLSFVAKGTWTINSTYSFGNTAICGGMVFVWSDWASGNARLESSESWQRLYSQNLKVDNNLRVPSVIKPQVAGYTFCGTYDPNIDYLFGDAVWFGAYSGYIWRSLEPGNSQPDLASGNWAALTGVSMPGGAPGHS